jgi:molybdopterin-guanine dinucleotide biosynthesis protein A
MPQSLAQPAPDRQRESGRIPVVVLAGGQARRMGGGDKGLRPFAGTTLLAAVLARLRDQAGPILINANGDAGRFERFGCPVLPDAPDVAGQGPLAGILAALDWAVAAGHAVIATVPTDTPFLPLDLLVCLATARQAVSADVAYAVSSRRHPVVALWASALGPRLRQAVVEQGLRKVEAWLETLKTVPVPFPVGPVDPFLNLNTPEELVEAAALLRRLDPMPL